MTELREKLNNIVEDYNACKMLAKGVGNPSAYEGTTATASDIRAGKTAYSNGSYITGTMASLNGIIDTAEDTAEIFTVINNLRYLSVADLDLSKYTSFKGSFQNLINLKELEGEFDTGETTTLENTFDGCASLKKITFKDTSKIQTWTKAFQNCAELEEIENLDMSGATAITYAFSGCSKLKSIPKLTKSFSSYEGTFQDCAEMEEIPISQTTIPDSCSIRSAFAGMKKIKTAPIVNIPRQNAVRYNAFEGCESLESVTLVNTGGYTFTDVSVSSMFQNCKSLKEVPAIFDNFALRNGCSYLFAGCTSLKTTPRMYAVATSTSMASLFEGCTNLESATLQVNCTQTGDTYFKNVFKDCVNLKNVTITGSSYGISNWFENCKSLTSIPEGILVNGFPASYGVRAFAGSGITELPEGLFQGVSLSGTNSRRSDFSGLFADCKQLQHIPVLPMSFNWANGMAGMFSGCDALTDDSLNNIMATFMANTNAGYKYLSHYGFSAEQRERCKTLPNYGAFVAAGWQA